ncbi:hypothetical protein [Marinomonas sp. MED121]|jgi:hypothetical protein|uniref:hypothetical protein n=1 Tax=Marinomonas sp. MED121 TaxID=314277 RepID=UPI00030F0ECC|nr:hypothetical protein [Marinomonas sp. MED121]
MFGEYTPLMKPGLMERRLANGKAYLDSELGLQKWCSHCEEYWPQDTLFWSVSSHKQDGLQCWCKACQLEHKRNKRQAA